MSLQQKCSLCFVPSVYPRLISFATLTAGLRSIFALSCFVSSQLSGLFLHLPRGHPVQSPFASLRANLRFTPDSFHSLPLRRGSEASSRCRALSDLGLPVPYSFYTFNFPTPATLAPPLYSLCSFFLEQSDDRLHLRSFPLRLSLMQPTSLQFRWPLFRRCAAPRPMAEACLAAAQKE